MDDNDSAYGKAVGEGPRLVVCLYVLRLTSCRHSSDILSTFL